MICKFLTFSKDVVLRGSVLWKSIIITFWVFAFWCLTAPSPALAVVVKLKKEVNPISVKGGEWEADILVNNKRVKNATAMGEWRVLKDRKSVFFTLTHIKKGNDYHTIKEQPSAKENVAKNKTFKKGRRIILGGENDSEISQILGVDKKIYSKTKKGSESGGGTAGGGGSDSESSGSSLSGSSSGSFGSKDDDTLASNGGGSGGGSNNGVIGGGGNNGGNGGNNGGGSIPLPPFGGGDDNGGGGNEGFVPPSVGGGGDNGDTNPPIVFPPDNGNNGGGSNGNGNGNDPIYSSQYCKPPQRTGNNMFLSVVDKAGNCLEIKAGRDDTKCEYRYDFGNRKAIKQTQFYYVDLENVTQNIGGCVDLEPEKDVPHRYELYASDTKCKLNTTEDKDYQGGLAVEFQKQILFRGADGMVHIARDCGDYAIVEEDLLKYEYDEKAQILYRIVDRYYMDPFENKKVYISRGVKSPYSFKAREYGCGDWEHNDTALESIRPTQIRVSDEKDGTYYDVTECDYSTTNGKSGKIVQPYTKLGLSEQPGEIEGNNNGIQSFEISQEDLFRYPRSKEVKCKGAVGETWWRTNSWTEHQLGNKKIVAKWKVKYTAVRVGQVTKYQRPKQDWESKASIYSVGSSREIWDRTPISLDINEAGLTDEWRMYYEISSGYWKNPEIIRSKEFNEWMSKNYRKGEGSYCISYNLSDSYAKQGDDKGRKYCPSTYAPNSVAVCIKSNYNIPKPATKTELQIEEKKVEERKDRERKRKIKEQELKEMRDYERRKKRALGGDDS